MTHQHPNYMIQITRLNGTDYSVTTNLPTLSENGPAEHVEIGSDLDFSAAIELAHAVRAVAVGLLDADTPVRIIGCQCLGTHE